MNDDITANCIIIAQILYFSLLFSGAILQIAPAQSDFQWEIGRLLCNSQYGAWLAQICTYVARIVVWIAAHGVASNNRNDN